MLSIRTCVEDADETNKMNRVIPYSSSAVLRAPFEHVISEQKDQFKTAINTWLSLAPQTSRNSYIGKRNNQNFVSIPYYILMHDVQYKAEEIWICVKVQGESHTSNCSSPYEEPVNHHDAYVGRRIKRGLFRSAKRMLINADRECIAEHHEKAIMKENVDKIVRIGLLHPVRVNLLQRRVCNANLNHTLGGVV